MKLLFTKLSITGTPVVGSYKKCLLLVKLKPLKLSKSTNNISKIRLVANKHALLHYK